MGHGRKIAVIGLGYVGLPVAICLPARASRSSDLISTPARWTNCGRQRPYGRGGPLPSFQPAAALGPRSRRLARADIFIVTVPTPIDDETARSGAVVAASETVGAGSSAANRRLRIDGLSRRHRGSLRAGSGGTPALPPATTSPSAIRPSASIPATRSTRSTTIIKGRVGPTPRRSTAWTRSTARSSRPACTAPSASRSPRPPRSSRTRSAISTSR